MISRFCQLTHRYLISVFNFPTSSTVTSSLTQHPWQDHPLHSGWCWPLPVLPVLLRGNDVLGGEEQQEQESQVGCRVADKLDEGLADEEAVAALRGDEVAESKQREEEANEDASDEFSCPVAPPPARKLVVPSGRQQLLTIRLCYKLYKKKKKDEGGLALAHGSKTNE